MGIFYVLVILAIAKEFLSYQGKKRERETIRRQKEMMFRRYHLENSIDTNTKEKQSAHVGAWVMFFISIAYFIWAMYC